jgi:hypothetical protein
MWYVANQNVFLKKKNYPVANSFGIMICSIHL